MGLSCGRNRVLARPKLFPYCSLSRRKQNCHESHPWTTERWVALLSGGKNSGSVPAWGLDVASGDRSSALVDFATHEFLSEYNDVYVTFCVVVSNLCI